MKLVLGGPGCGKTTRLLGVVADAMRNGIPPSQIAFVAFTRAAAHEARRRAAAMFRLDPEVDLPWFRTIHSMIYAALGLTKEEVLGAAEYAEFSRVVGEPFSFTEMVEGEEPVLGDTYRGDRLLRVVDYAATTQRTLLEAWHALNSPDDWFALKRFDAAYTGYKVETARMDFTDMLLMYLEDGGPVPITLAIVDEAQDLTSAQWAVVRKAFAGAEMVVGGDDDQSIYSWAGADTTHFLSLDAAQEVLHQSHRLPRCLYNFSQRIVTQIAHRYPKAFAPAREGGMLHYARQLELDFPYPGSYLVLARNTYLVAGVARELRTSGVPYWTRRGPSVDPGHVRAISLWEAVSGGPILDFSAPEVRALCKALGRPVPLLKETGRYTPTALAFPVHQKWSTAFEGIARSQRDYYTALQHNGHVLGSAPRIGIETIHGVKGAEADHVILRTDMSARTYEGYRKDPDNEHRVFYVGATRARQTLQVVLPQSDMAYEI